MSYPTTGVYGGGGGQCEAEGFWAQVGGGGAARGRGSWGRGQAELGKKAGKGIAASAAKSQRKGGDREGETKGDEEDGNKWHWK